MDENPEEKLKQAMTVPFYRRSHLENRIKYLSTIRNTRYLAVPYSIGEHARLLGHAQWILKYFTQLHLRLQR